MLFMAQWCADKSLKALELRDMSQKDAEIRQHYGDSGLKVQGGNVYANALKLQTQQVYASW